MFTAPVAEPIVMSFTVPLVCCIIVATATVVTSCLCRDVVWWSGWCLQFYLGQREAYDWKIHRLLFPVPRGRWGVCMLNYLFSSNDDICPDNYNYSGAGCQYQEDVGCVCMLNGWISCSDGICADNHNYFQFKLKGKGRSAGGTDPRVLFVD